MPRPVPLPASPAAAWAWPGRVLSSEKAEPRVSTFLPLGDQGALWRGQAPPRPPPLPQPGQH